MVKFVVFRTDYDEFSFEFDDDVEENIEEDSLDLALEMMESSIQKAAGMVLINSKKTLPWVSAVKSAGMSQGTRATHSKS